MKILKDLALVSLGAFLVTMSACTGTSDNQTQNNEPVVKCSNVDTDSIHEVTLLEENISYSACLDCNILDDRKMEVWGPNFVCREFQRPVVMFVPSMSIKSVEEFVRPLVENGYVVAVPKCANIKNEANKDKTLDGLRCGVNDLTDAIRKVKLNHEKYGADTSKIFLAGVGSGAEIALNYCYIKGLYDKVDMEGIKGVIALGPNASLNFEDLEKNEDCKLQTLVLMAENETEEVKDAVSAIQRQLGNLVNVKVMPVVDPTTTLSFSDTLHVQSAKFIQSVLN
ncbi:MAG: alpha/beta hydrolase fold domain-containing protein [Paludibacteraceae bacterium]|nr:alpha/beta hydrolase fold domain-containing protein [Paludibacteraceae bacterium]